jgi:hypothetical protein
MSMPRGEIVKFWGRENLARWLPSLLIDVAIPEQSKRFLSDVGLPVGVDWTLEIAPMPLERLEGKPHFRKLCSDYIVPICLDELDAGSLVAVEQIVGGGERFVNTDVEAFGQFLVLYQRYRRADQPEELILATESAMKRTDPRAFSSVENYWPVIIEQMHHGLL